MDYLERQLGTLLLNRIKFDRPTAGGTGRRGVLALLGTMFQGGARLLTNILLGRLGGPELLGITQSVTSTANLGALFLPTSAGGAASKYVALYRGKGDYEGARDVARFISTRTVQATAVIAMIALAIGAYFQSLSIEIIVVTSLLLVAMCGQSFIRGVHFGASEVNRLVSWDIAISVGSLSGVLCLLLLGVRNVWVLAPAAAITLIFVALSWPNGSGRRIPKPTRREIERFIALGIVGTISSSGFLQSSILVAAATHGLRYAGEYSAALSLTAPISLVAGSVSLVLFPSMAEAHGRNDGASIRVRTQSATRLLITMMIAMFGVIGILAAPITSIVWGSEFQYADEILVVLLLAVTVGTIAVPSVNALTTKSNKGMAISASSSLGGFAVGATAWILLSAPIPSLSVPLGYLIGAVVIAGIPYAIIWKQQKNRWLPQTATVILAVLIVLAMIFTIRYYEMQTMAQIGMATGFLSVWIGIRNKDISTLIRILRSPSKNPALKVGSPNDL